MKLFSSLFHSRDKPKNSTAGSALVFVVKVKDATAEITGADIVGTVSETGERTGLKLFETAGNKYGFEPMIYIAPRYSALDAVKQELIVITEKTEAMAYIDTPDGWGFNQAIESRGAEGDFATLKAGQKLLFPHVLVANPEYNPDVEDPGERYLTLPVSAYAAGLRAKVDLTEGWHVSSSNHAYTGIEGTDVPITFALSDKTCEANLLNAQGITTVVNMYGNGIVEWGNYTAAFPSTTTPDAFECVRRSLMIMKRSITMACAQFIDVKQVKQADIDLFVLDDGWFKGRNDTSSSLGDWAADTRKLPQGLPGLCKKINLLGLDMGLWVEPEAISPDSDLYRAHPDWAFGIPGREPLEIRQQYTLDFSRPEVVAGIWQQLDAVLQSCPLKYLKWDMNRSLAQVYSAVLPAKRQGEVYHRYVLGVYELQRRLTEKYPHLLLENCAGGGARFDCGMLYYSPQIWCSDNTDARSRLVIQYGTSLFYPGCVMGAHFSTVPNHCTGHISTVEARMAAALTGTFGFELDLTKYTEEELAQLRSFVAWYRAHGALLRGGELHRLVNPDANGLGAAWMLSAKDGSEAAVFAVGDALTGSHGTASLNARPRLVLAGLDPAAQYRDEENNTYTGAQLLTTGLELPGGCPQRYGI